MSKRGGKAGVAWSKKAGVEERVFRAVRKTARKGTEAWGVSLGAAPRVSSPLQMSPSHLNGQKKAGPE
ncbi:hypothetical protein, partial [Thermogutta sp.]|uniref:hypothetical protein n=1 Tax=Thermogutta sp. TaxID=1962930 RepID=UPI0032202FE5